MEKVEKVEIHKRLFMSEIGEAVLENASLDTSYCCFRRTR
jgi:hypothetical protein